MLLHSSPTSGPPEPYLPRPRVEALLDKALRVPITLIQAEAGYGKTCAILGWVQTRHLAHVWLSLTSREQEGTAFANRLAGALGLRHPLPEALGEAPCFQGEDPFLIILDDYHLAESPETNYLLSHLVENLPPQAHLILLSRNLPNLPRRHRWRAYGEWLEVHRKDLAFIPEEAAALFTQAGCPLGPEEAEEIVRETEGWPVALRLLLEKAKALNRPPGDLLREAPRSLEELFDFLAQEVLRVQEGNVQEFLLKTAVLSRLEPSVCQWLMPKADAHLLLKELAARPLFLTPLPEGGYRYHPLFQRFLLRHAEHLQPLEELHRRVAHFYLEGGQREEAVPHLLAAQEFSQALEVLETLGEALIERGDYHIFAKWCESVPGYLLQGRPLLLRMLGDALRFLSRFSEAERCYKEALNQTTGREHALCLKGLASVYLDTVQPLKAAPLLKQALDTVQRTPGLEPMRRDLLYLLAENEVNRGRLRRAKILYEALGKRGKGEAENPRLYVRMGLLLHAKSLLEEWEATYLCKTPGAHREPPLVLSWIGAFLGNREEALRNAQRGLERGQAMASPIVECVAWARVGHAWLTGEFPNLAQAQVAYRRSLEISRKIDVPRFSVEARLGLGLVEAQLGRTLEALNHLSRGLRELTEAGDYFLASVLTLATGITLGLGKSPEAQAYLREAANLGNRCGDVYVPTSAYLWLAYTAYEQGNVRAAMEAMEQALQEVATHPDLAVLLLGAPLLGLRPAEKRLFLLRQALALGVKAETTLHLMVRLLHLKPRLTGSLPPGSTRLLGKGGLFVQTLGDFRIWRNLLEEVEPSAFGRSKALRLFQLLLANRGRAVPKEAILEALWPEKDPQDASVLLRVALSYLSKALEPERPPGEPCRFLIRQGNSLSLNRELILCDVDLFEELLEEGYSLLSENPEGSLDRLREAISLYQGDFLYDCPYEDWAEEERERLREELLNAALTAGKLLFRSGRPWEATSMAHKILETDPFCEEGYHLLIRSYWELGHKGLALRAYNRYRKKCEELKANPLELEEILRQGGKNPL